MVVIVNTRVPSFDGKKKKGRTMALPGYFQSITFRHLINLETEPVAEI